MTTDLKWTRAWPSYMTPHFADVACAVDGLNVADRERFEERAVMLEYGTGLARGDAERYALNLVLALKHPPS